MDLKAKMITTGLTITRSSRKQRTKTPPMTVLLLRVNTAVMSPDLIMTTRMKERREAKVSKTVTDLETSHQTAERYVHPDKMI